ncbi:MAG: hypothetical protein ISS35_02730 [Kiritimatiellae bacterium]|nr:hypothetical protein [Kiritimatiellia bacterium]
MILRRKQLGYTLVEIAIAGTMLVVVLSLSMRGFIHLLSGSSQQRVQNELDIDVQTAMERIKADLRLTSLAEVYLSPANGPIHKAISFPLARDDDGDGAVDIDSDGNIIWDRTMIYHVWDGSPNQLRLTIFDPRNNDLSAQERQEQVNAVLKAGGGTATHNGRKGSTSVVFENLFNWNVTPAAPEYDGYADTQIRDVGASLGTCILTPGAHTLTFSVTDKNPSSSGYAIGIDYLVASPSYSIREAEAQLPAKSQYGASAVASFMPAGSWSGNYELNFPSKALNHSFSLSIYNDCWEETNFDTNGQNMKRVRVKFDETISPSDYMVSLRGMETNWLAADQTADPIGTPLHSGEMVNTAIRVLLAGDDMVNGGWIYSEGERCRINFRAGRSLGSPGGLVVWGATIAEANSISNITMDANAGTMTQLRFNNGYSHAVIPAGTERWSDFANLTVKPEKSYLVSFATTTLADWGDPWMWENVVYTNDPCCFIIPSTSTPTYTECYQANWSSRTDVIATNKIYGVRAMYASYPTNGTYTSAAFDTHMDSPSFSTISWNAITPTDGKITTKVRSATLSDMSGATDWSGITAMGSPGPISPGNGRYIQFQTTFFSDSTHLETPKLRDVRIDWPGETRAVDVGGAFTKAPDHGTFKVLVDGQPLHAAVRVDLEIFKDARGYGGTRRLTSALSAEVQPLNTR